MLAFIGKVARTLAGAWFLDIPFLIDSRWRHIEYALNAEGDYEPGAHPTFVPRSFWRKPPFWFFVITLFYVAYGPTWGGLCAVLPVKITSVLRETIGVAIVAISVALGLWLLWVEFAAIRQRLNRQPAPDEFPALRGVTVSAALLVGVGVITWLGVEAGLYVFAPARETCAISDGSKLAALQLGFCLVAVGLFALAAHLARGRANLAVYAQVAILAAFALVQWNLLATAGAREASDLPYRHVFAFWAPCIVATLAVAPLLAWWIFRPGLQVDASTRDRFRALLAETELFVNRGEPALSTPRILYAIVYGPVYHPLHLLLLPSLVALTADAEYLNLSVAIALIVSFLILVWGNISSRWQELVIYLERWFLRGAPLLVSVFVIVVAILRVAQFEYVSTLLDAAPLGTTFGLVAMTYVLFWLTEYWLSRIVATRLLDILGPLHDPYAIRYPFPLDPTHPPRADDPDPIRVSRNNRYLACHGTGRFVALGTVAALDGPPIPDSEGNAIRAFQPYYLVDLFKRLGERTGVAEDHEKVATINRLTGIYFFTVNALMLVVTFAFVAAFYDTHYLRDNGIAPVAVATPAPMPQLVDLPSLLTQKTERPAIVVIGSGGGTRAALYTISVLHGLHCLGADRDIVLLSGVSGGGVSLAYFAANRDSLIAVAPASDPRCDPNATVPKPKPDAQEPWMRFSARLGGPFIEDVLNGVTEWRIFRDTSPSALLAESFKRRVFGDRTTSPANQPTLGSLKNGPNAPALILNATITAHPEEDSAVLWATLDPYPDNKCAMAERVFTMMSGGRLIFTNLKDTGAFPRAPSPQAWTDTLQPIPDIRLPYRIVQASDVLVASAAALNANFPPVFSDARVRIIGAYPAPCPDRSFYVTDGGAVENLGLFSALYALKSALAIIQAKPPTQPGQRVRPIHIVIAEASGAGYDYSNDRGISVALGPSRERLSGGLTNQLLADVNQQLAALNGEGEHLFFHYIPLPLVFRARGGFGTHWLYAEEFHFNDPRPRAPSPWDQRPAWLGGKEVILKREELEGLWKALHAPKPFCPHQQFVKPDHDKDTDPKMNTVADWICDGVKGEGRDLHIQQWNELVQALARR